MNIVRDKIGVWLATIMVALLTIFSDKILERIRFRVNIADLRTKYFEELAVNLSTYLFYAELYHERYQKGWANDPEDMAGIGGEINRAVTTLTIKEYVYRAWVKKYWGSDAVKPFNEVMTAVKSVDDAIHAFNDPGKEKEKTTELGKRLGILRAEIDQWLVHYSRNPVEQFEERFARTDLTVVLAAIPNRQGPPRVRFSQRAYPGFPL